MSFPLDSNQTLGIVGPGLIGASIGLAAKKAGFSGTIIGVARKQATVDCAKERGAVDIATTSLEQAIEQSDLLIIAVPLSGFAAIFKAIAQANRPELIITDAGSTKLTVQQQAERELTHPAKFVGAHPMAGKSQQGPEAACDDLFEGKPCVLCPTDLADAQAVDLVKEFWQALQMNIIEMSPQQHDAHVAYTSHLPHAVAALLIQLANEQAGFETASTGLRDTTRLASSNPAMRTDIMLENHQPLADALQTMSQACQTLSEQLRNNDRQAIQKNLDAIQQIREDWLK